MSGDRPEEGGGVIASCNGRSRRKTVKVTKAFKCFKLKVNWKIKQKKLLFEITLKNKFINCIIIKNHKTYMIKKMFKLK